jgi:hypothetical protein
MLISSAGICHIKLHVRDLAAAAAACGAEYRQTNEHCRSCSSCGNWASAQACRLFRKVVLMVCCAACRVQHSADIVHRTTLKGPTCLLYPMWLFLGALAIGFAFKRDQGGKDTPSMQGAAPGPLARVLPRSSCQRTRGSLNASHSCMQALNCALADRGPAVGCHHSALTANMFAVDQQLRLTAVNLSCICSRNHWSTASGV